MSDLTSFLPGALERLRAQRPLVQNITNFVSMDVVANLLLALGASPAMVHSSEEVEDFASLAAALAVNIGTLTPDWVASMRLAARRMSDGGRPWVLDPVGAGATPYRTTTANNLVALKPAIIRGNASEIAALAGARLAPVKGVDSRAASGEAVVAARQLSSASGAVVVVSGAIDYVTDGSCVIGISGGSPMMTYVTALGCSLSAANAAFACVCETPLQAAIAASAAFGVAGQRASLTSAGPGSFRTAFIDAIFALNPEILLREAQIERVD